MERSNREDILTIFEMVWMKEIGATLTAAPFQGNHNHKHDYPFFLHIGAFVAKYSRIIKQFNRISVTPCSHYDTLSM